MFVYMNVFEWVWVRIRLFREKCVGVNELQLLSRFQDKWFSVLRGRNSPCSQFIIFTFLSFSYFFICLPFPDRRAPDRLCTKANLRNESWPLKGHTFRPRQELRRLPIVSLYSSSRFCSFPRHPPTFYPDGWYLSSEMVVTFSAW